MSTTALRIIELVKSLPDADQQAIRVALIQSRTITHRPKRRQLHRLPNGQYLNPEGIPNDDPVFAVLEAIEEARHCEPGPPPPDFE